MTAEQVIPHQKIDIRRRRWRLNPDPSHVICRPHIPSGNAERIKSIIHRVLALPDLEADSLCGRIMLDFSERHRNLPRILDSHFRLVERYLPEGCQLTRAKRILLGAYFTMEYSVSSAALFNPSIVRHPDQNQLGENEVRFVMSLRAVGEGHISSLAFRSGIVKDNGVIIFDPVSDYVETPIHEPNPLFNKKLFLRKLSDLGVDIEKAKIIFESLGEQFSFNALDDAIAKLEKQHIAEISEPSIATIEWLANSNYEVDFKHAQSMSERVIFPVSQNDRAGIEDARFVEFMHENGTSIYYATYTAYDGRNILPQLIETKDFSHFKVSTLNGQAVRNKGMALFPRKINGKYMMLARQDGERNFIMTSDDLYFWQDASIIQEPQEPWEFIQLGNCGSPIETREGWLVLTHGVGPMREYSIGAILLDINEPRKVIAKLKNPLLRPHEEEREGYVPNVVYSCGALLHNDELLLPYAMSDISSGLVSMNVYELISAMDRLDV